MLSLKENFLETIYNGKPEYFVNEWEPFGLVFDPLMAMTMNAVPNQSIVDGWGVTQYWGPDEASPMPITTTELKAIKDVTKWKEDIKTPDIKNGNLDWMAAVATK
ncbi:uroporphyrinogen decarboxylase/cobalamine-independent methonine synthase family protein [Novisyntrophococcus fermenticellae]|uniref:hypothetical protein n=1 Tax=Novisyntrophococcus fermenticellae TaxID=2068655 RepID=UPI001E4D4D66|nr:hypothetical protein [Novisyntrophococcus fermenticellae]